MVMYRVCGSRAVLGHLPGDEFPADLPEVQEQRLVAGGHIERLVPSRGDVIETQRRLADQVLDLAKDQRGPEHLAPGLVFVQEAAAEEFPDVPDDRAGEPDQDKE